MARHQSVVTCLTHDLRRRVNGRGAQASSGPMSSPESTKNASP